MPQVRLRATVDVWIFVPKDAQFLISMDVAADMILHKRAKLESATPINRRLSKAYRYSLTFPADEYFGDDGL
jgi:hypothetical protein